MMKSTCYEIYSFLGGFAPPDGSIALQFDFCSHLSVWLGANEGSKEESQYVIYGLLAGKHEADSAK